MLKEATFHRRSSDMMCLALVRQLELSTSVYYALDLPRT